MVVGLNVNAPRAQKRNGIKKQSTNFGAVNQKLLKEMSTANGARMVALKARTTGLGVSKVDVKDTVNEALKKADAMVKFHLKNTLIAINLGGKRA